MLYSEIVEIDERVDIHGNIIKKLDKTDTEIKLKKAFDNGYRSIAIVLLHGYRYQNHEAQIHLIAKEIGFKQISVSHQVSPINENYP